VCSPANAEGCRMIVSLFVGVLTLLKVVLK
jgi:hypothetical protein